MPEDQLSLAIGKDGRNVRLAANLTGWKIDIKMSDKVVEETEGGEEVVVEDGEPVKEESASAKASADKEKPKKEKKSKKGEEDKKNS